jgi:tellurite resistance protein TerA
MSVSFSKDATPVSGAVTLSKGDAPVLLQKGSAPITAEVSWSSGTDYDVYALVVLTNGDVVPVATFGAKHSPANPNYRELVRHLGDKVRSDVAAGGGRAVEVIEIVLDPSIRAVVPVVYSAQSNGAGSFSRYAVSMAIRNGADTVTVPADHANNDDSVYTCVPGIIHNLPEGVVVEYLESYSKRGSEDRPRASLDRHGDVRVEMDKGPKNDYK